MRRRLLIGSLVSASAAALTAGAVVNLNAFVRLQGSEYALVLSPAAVPADPRVMAVEHLITGAAPVLGWITAGAVLAGQRTRNALGWWFLTYGLLLSCVELLAAVDGLRLTMTGWTAGYPWMRFLPFTAQAVVLLTVPTVVLVLSYPDGRLPARWWRWPVGVVVASIAWRYASVSLPEEIWFLSMWAPAAATTVVAIFVCRPHSSYPQGRQWARFAGCALLAFTCRCLLTSDGTSFGSGPVLLQALTDPMLIIPIGAAAGVLRHRLLGIPAVVRRGLVYAALTALLYNVYQPLARGAGLTLDSHPLFAVAVAAGVVGLARTRHRLQRAAARFVYGARRNPLQAMAELSDSVAENTHLDLVPAAVATVAAAVGADGAAIVTPDGRVLARTGQEPDHYLALSLRFRGAEIGELRVANPPGGELYSEVEIRLLSALATQLAVVVSAAELTESLEAERNRVVTVTRDERDRLRRDLHDGLGPSLAGMSLGLQALATQIGDPDTPAGTLVRRLQSGTDTAVRDIRRIIDGLRPTVLDTADLAQAVERHATSLGAALPVDVTATGLPVLATDVEVAAYRIITEALTNAARHAQARHARVTITADEALHIAVSDDGHGMPADVATAGVGLSSMRRRAEALGGALAVDSGDGGTTVTATLPLSSSRGY